MGNSSTVILIMFAQKFIIMEKANFKFYSEFIVRNCLTLQRRYQYVTANHGPVSGNQLRL